MVKILNFLFYARKLSSGIGPLRPKILGLLAVLETSQKRGKGTQYTKGV